MLKIARVFPRRTKATPTDELVFTKPPPKILPDIDEVHVSVTFSYDLDKAEELMESWEKTGLPIKIGGPVFGLPGGDFTPGLYLKHGYVITSRGCPNTSSDCWFCSVPKREGSLRELPITNGHNILDDNLLACSERHIRAVFAMLKNQPEKPLFTGGLEAQLLKPWHVNLLREVKTKRLYCSFDRPEDYEPLVQAGKILREGGISKGSHAANCYVLIGYPGDNMSNAEKRLHDTWTAGFFPFAMLYRNAKGEACHEWKQFQTLWARPQTTYDMLKRGYT